MGVWIETDCPGRECSYRQVTPYVGVWIETPSDGTVGDITYVTPYVGVWIETKADSSTINTPLGHSLCGSVD